MKLTVCVHQLPDFDPRILPECQVIARTTSRDELTHALTATACDMLLIDLDQPDALNVIISATEVCENLAVVGLTGAADLERIIQAQRAGCQQITRKPIDPHDLRSAVQRAAADLVGERGLNRCFAVMGPTGGSGATTLACHLAVELANISHQRTLLVDLDFDFGGVARAFDLHPQFTIADMAKASSIDQAVLAKTVVRVENGPEVLARPASIADAHAVTGEHARQVIRTANDAYTNVVIDLPRKLDEITGAGIEQCQRLLLVVQLTVPSVDNATRLLEILRGEGITTDRVDLVINRYRKNMHACTIEMVEKQLGLQAAGMVPSDFSSVHRAIDAGVLLSPKHAVRSSINELAQKLIGADEMRSGKGWFGKLGFARGVS